MATEVDLVVGLGGLVDGLGLLGVVDQALVTVGVDASGLVVDEAGVLVKIDRQHLCSFLRVRASHSMGHACPLPVYWTSTLGGFASYLAGVLVDQVQRVARELNTTGLLALDQVGVVVACVEISLLATLPHHQ